MKILLLSIGRTADVNLKDLLLDFNNRVSHYVHFNHIEIQSIKNSKNLSVNEQIDKEASLIKKKNYKWRLYSFT